MTADEHFDLANRYIGWGVPPGSIWFIGMEEGAVFGDEDLRLLRSYSEDARFQFPPIDGPALYYGEPQLRNPPKLPIRSTQCTRAESFVAGGLLGIDAATFLRDHLWRTATFHANLFPLGWQRGGDWPPHYGEYFGQPSHSDAYRERVAGSRFGWLRQLTDKIDPAAIVCFGKTEWPSFIKMFGHADEDYTEGVIRTNANQRIVLAPHFSNCWFFKVREEVLAVLRGWRVHEKLAETTLRRPVG